MFPIRDSIPSRTTPWINYLILWVNVGVWAYSLTLDQSALMALFQQWGLVPVRYAASALPVSAELAAPFVSSMFLHGGWLHIIGNLWMLWIFGDNVEDHLGHFRYLLFYLLCGVGAGAVHLFTNWGSPIPTVGASGAIAGVMAAYMVLYPMARVLTYVPVVVFLLPIWLPAIAFIGFWFVLQFMSGTASLLSVQEDGGGVAWWAHIGGFLWGLVLLGVLGAGRPRRARSAQPRLGVARGARMRRVRGDG